MKIGFTSIKGLLQSSKASEQSGLTTHAHAPQSFNDAERVHTVTAANQALNMKARRAQSESQRQRVLANMHAPLEHGTRNIDRPLKSVNLLLFQATVQNLLKSLNETQLWDARATSAKELLAYLDQGEIKDLQSFTLAQKTHLANTLAELLESTLTTLSSIQPESTDESMHTQDVKQTQQALWGATEILAALTASVQTQLPHPGASHLYDDETHLLNVSRADLGDLLPAAQSALQNLVDIKEQGFDNVYHEHVLEGQPSEALKHEFLPSTASSLGISSGIAALVLPLTLIALRAGIRDTLKAIKSNKELNAKTHLAQRSIEHLKSLMECAPEKIRCLLDETIHNQEQELELLRFAKSMNQLSGGIAASSAISSAILATNVGEEFASKLALVAVDKGFHAGQYLNSAAANAATGLSIAGTCVLAPLYGIAATTAAGAITYKSVQKKRNFREGKEKVDLLLQNRAAQIEKEEELCHQKYQHFLQTKLSQRDQFYGSSVNWNKSFLTASSLYTTTSITKMTVIALALTGAGAAAANPIGASILLGGGILSGIGMGASSLKSLHNRNKLQRYDHYHNANDSELEREFLNAVDIMHPQGASKGFDIRARFYDLISSREYRRQYLLAEMAEGKNKSYQPVHYSTDGITLPPSHKTKGNAFQKKLQARFYTETARMKHLVQGKPKQAQEKARETWSQKADTLTSLSIQQWLQDPGNFPKQVDFMLAEMKAQLTYLEQKISTRDEIFGRLSSFDQDNAVEKPSIPDESIATDQEGNAYSFATLLKEFLGEQAESRARDKLLHAHGKILMNHLTDLKKKNAEGLGSAANAGELSKLKEGFLHLQIGQVPVPLSDSSPDINQQFAKYLQKDAPNRYRDLRGILIETEIQAARLRERPIASKDVPQTSKGPEDLSTHLKTTSGAFPVNETSINGGGRRAISAQTANSSSTHPTEAKAGLQAKKESVLSGKTSTRPISYAGPLRFRAFKFADFTSGKTSTRPVSYAGPLKFRAFKFSDFTKS